MLEGLLAVHMGVLDQGSDALQHHLGAPFLVLAMLLGLGEDAFDLVHARVMLSEVDEADTL